MRALAKLWIIGMAFLGSIAPCLAQSIEESDPVDVLEPPPAIVFPEWREVGRAEEAIEYAVNFPSPLTSPYESNNSVNLRILVPEPISGPVPVVLVLHYWGATDLKAERSFAAELNRRGIAVAIMALPYHLSRTPPNRRSGELAIEPDPAKLRTVMLQAMLDGRRSIDFLQSRPELRGDRIGLMGTSLGGVVAALLYAVEPRITDVAFVVGGIDLARILWESSRVVPQRDALRSRGYTEARLRTELSSIEPMTYLPRKTPGTSFVVAGLYDTVVPRAATERLIERLHNPQVLWLDTGHYGGIFVQRRLFREVARFFETEFSGTDYKAPLKLVAPTVRIGVKIDALLGPDLGVGIDLIRFDGEGRNFVTALVTPSSVQFLLAHRLSQGFSLASTISTRGLGFGIFWSSVL